MNSNQLPNQTNTIASKICDTNYSLNNAINTLATGVERGFASTNYATQTQTCEILRDNQRNTQHIMMLDLNLVKLDRISI